MANHYNPYLQFKYQFKYQYLDLHRHMHTYLTISIEVHSYSTPISYHDLKIIIEIPNNNKEKHFYPNYENISYNIILSIL